MTILERDFLHEREHIARVGVSGNVRWVEDNSLDTTTMVRKLFICLARLL
jgi:hypothetical protein